ncbi:MAG TPA: hypothetical protein VGC21_18735 [Telluria sp.]|jgi:hypothetical protein
MTKKPRHPKRFEKSGDAYIGHAVALLNELGQEIIVLAPTAADAVLAGERISGYKMDRSKIVRALLTHEAAK